MARFVIEKTVYNYSFTPPEIISEEEYNLLKMKASLKPNERIFTQEDPEESINRTNFILLIGFVVLLIGLFGMYSDDSSPAWAGLLIFFSIFLIISPILNGGIRESEQNKSNAEKKKNEYYITLEELIRKSRTYNDFRLSYQLKYSSPLFRY